MDSAVLNMQLGTAATAQQNFSKVENQLAAGWSHWSILISSIQTNLCRRRSRIFKRGSLKKNFEKSAAKQTIAHIYYHDYTYI